MRALTTTKRAIRPCRPAASSTRLRRPSPRSLDGVSLRSSPRGTRRRTSLRRRSSSIDRWSASRTQGETSIRKECGSQSEPALPRVFAELAGHRGPPRPLVERRDLLFVSGRLPMDRVLERLQECFKLLDPSLQRGDPLLVVRLALFSSGLRL